MQNHSEQINPSPSPNSSNKNPSESDQISQASALERAELLGQAIRNHDAKKVKAILKAGLNVKEGCHRDRSLSGLKVSFKVLLEDEMSQNLGSKELKKIGNLLAKYGCEIELLKVKQAEIREYEQNKLLNQLAIDNETRTQNRENIRAKYDKFIKKLKLGLLQIMYGIISGASGRLAFPAVASQLKDQLANYLEKSKEGISKYIDEKLVKEIGLYLINSLSEKAFGTIPLIGKSIVTGINFSYRKREIQYLAQKFKDIVDDNASVDSIIHAYSIGAVQYHAEIIAKSGQSEAELNELDGLQKYRGLTLIEKYKDLFLISIDQLNSDYKSQENPGGFFKKKIFYDRRIREEDFRHFQEGISNQNIRASAKFLVYLEDVGQCKNYLKTWSFAEDVYQLKDLSWGKSVIIGSPEKIIFCFCGLNKSPEKFFSDAIYENKIDEEIILGPIFEQLFEMSKDAEVYIIGDSDSMATQICQKFIETVKIEPHKISLYLFGTKTPKIQDQMKMSSQSQKAQRYFDTNSEISEIKNFQLDKSTLVEAKEMYLTLKPFSEIEKTHLERRAIIYNLHTACGEGDFDLVRYFVEERKSDINSIWPKKGPIQEYRGTPLNYVFRKCNYVFEKAQDYSHVNILLVLYLIEKGADFTVSDISGNKLSCHIARSGNFEFLKYLIEEKGLDVNDQEKYKITLLHIACQNEDFDIVKYLIEKGANVKSKNIWIGGGGLHIACRSGNMELVKLLLVNGADMNEDGLGQLTTFFDDRKTPLCFAAETGQFEIVKFLVNQGADLHLGFMRGELVLARAVESSHFEMVKYLIEKGADVNGAQIRPKPPISDSFVDRLIHKAVHSKNIEILKYLVENKVDVNAKNISGATALGIAAEQKQDYFGMVKYLVENNADITMASLLDYLKVQDKIHVIQYLTILRLQRPELFDKPLDLKTFQKSFDSLCQRGCSWYNLSTYFVSECIRLENKALKKLDEASVEDLRKIKTETEILLAYLERFFSGDEKIQIYNTAIKLLLSNKPERFDGVLELCERFSQDKSFILLKGLVYTMKASCSFIVKEEKERYQTKIEEILSRFEDGYVRAELMNHQGHYDEALLLYSEILKNEPNFGQAKVRKVEILIKLGRVKEAEELYTEVALQVLSIDTEEMLAECKEMLTTQYFLDEQQKKEEAEHSFENDLKQAFTVDIKRIQSELKTLLPQKLKKKYKSLLENLDYASKITKNSLSWWRNKSLPDNRDHELFDGLKSMIEKLNSLKGACGKNFCTIKDFNDDKNETNRTRFLKRGEEAQEYFKDYIQAVLADFRQECSPDYLSKFKKTRRKLLDVERATYVLSEDGQHYLLKGLAQQEITLEGPTRTQKHGTHKIAIYPNDKENEVYYKYMPDAPTVEFAVSSLYHELAPNINMTPKTRLLQITKDKKSVLYLASKGVVGRNFSKVINQQDLIEKLDIDNFSGLFISSLLVCPGDAKPDNFVMRFIYDSRGLRSTELVSVDNDIAFCQEKLEINSKGTAIYSDILNILYLLPQMDKPVSPFIRDYLLKEEAEIIIARWLKTLQDKNNKYEIANQEASKLKRPQSFLPIKLPSGTASRIYSQLKRMISLLKCETTTHNHLFQLIYPNICDFYKKSRDSVSVVNSLKNLYAATGADPNLINSLYSCDRIVSHQAWNVFSASKRQNVFHLYQNILNTSIEDIAKEFVEKIDFSLLRNDVIAQVGWKLSFSTHLVLQNINLPKLYILCQVMKNLIQVTLLRCPVQEDYSEFIQDYPKIIVKIPEPQQNVSPKIIHSQEPAPLKINSILDLTKKSFLQQQDLTPTSLMQVITGKNLDINERDDKGLTALDIALLQGNRSLVQILLEVQCDITVQKDGKSTLESCNDLELKVMVLNHKPKFLWEAMKAKKRNEVTKMVQAIAPSHINPFPVAFSKEISNFKENGFDFFRQSDKKKNFQVTIFSPVLL